MSAAQPSAPAAPGNLTRAFTIGELRAYLEALGPWRTALDKNVDALDTLAQRSQTPDAYSNDVTLAMALRASIDARCDELVNVWDSGRVGDVELARAAEMVWGRLPDALGNPSAFSLVEACTLVAALYARIDTELSADVLAGSGATDEIVAVRGTLARAAVSAATLRRREEDVAALSTRLDTLLHTTARADIRAAVAKLSTEVFALEALLVKEIGLRSAVSRDAASAAATRIRLLGDESTLRELAAVARSKIVDAPNLAIPDVRTLGDPPTVPGADVDAEPGTWTTVRGRLDDYLSRLANVDAALREATTRYGAGLARRGELRGLLGAYRDRAQRSGLGEDDALAEEYQAAHDVLYHAPCDVARAELLVGRYQHSVLAATTLDHSLEER